ncbi:MAG: hypothetical protein QM756_43195 [Polyangiaceae bacterium]
MGTPATLFEQVFKEVTEGFPASRLLRLLQQPFEIIDTSLTS